MDRARTGPSISRRAAMIGLARAGLAGGTIAAIRLGSGPEAPASAEPIASHPIVGFWLAATPLGPADMLFTDDGDACITRCHSQNGTPGDFFHTHSATGTWTAISERAVTFTAVQVDLDERGVEIGSTTLDGDPTVSDDGQSFQSTRTVVTVEANESGWPGPLSAIRMRANTNGAASAPPQATGSNRARS